MALIIGLILYWNTPAPSPDGHNLVPNATLSDREGELRCWNCFTNNTVFPQEAIKLA
jgi:hypothetical protein